jgi:hypothetical protein
MPVFQQQQPAAASEQDHDHRAAWINRYALTS